MISRPSNSGMATCMAASIGVSAAVEAAHWARAVVRQSPCRIGTSRPARAPASQSPPWRPPAAEPPAASTVVITASAWPRRSISWAPLRSEAQKTGSGVAPRRPWPRRACRRTRCYPTIRAPGRTPRPPRGCFHDLGQIAGYVPRTGHDHGRGGGGGRARASGGGGEALAGEQDGVGEEAGELAEVARAAFAQVAEGLGGDARGHRGQRHQLRVRRGLAAEHDQRQAGGAERGHPVRPGLAAAEQAQHDQAGAAGQRGNLVRRDPRRVGDQVAGAGRGGREQFGVGGGNQENGEHSPILPCSATANSRSTHSRRTG